MKARVKATGEIIDVEFSHYIADVAWYKIKGQALYSENELEFIDAPQDYWTGLEHQYAGMAMQGILHQWGDTYISCPKSKEQHLVIVVNAATEIAHALVEKLKEKEERK